MTSDAVAPLCIEEEVWTFVLWLRAAEEADSWPGVEAVALWGEEDDAGVLVVSCAVELVLFWSLDLSSFKPAAGDCKEWSSSAPEKGFGSSYIRIRNQ